jgi:hypothetical protein
MRHRSDEHDVAVQVAAGVRLIRWPVKLRPDRSEIRMEVLQT